MVRFIIFYLSLEPISLHVNPMDMHFMNETLRNFLSNSICGSSGKRGGGGRCRELELKQELGLQNQIFSLSCHTAPPNLFCSAITEFHG